MIFINIIGFILFACVSAREDECCNECGFQIVSERFPDMEGCYFEFKDVSIEEEYTWFTTNIPEGSQFEEQSGKRRTLFPGFGDRYYLNFITSDGDDITCRTRDTLPFGLPVEIENQGWEGCDVNSSDYLYDDISVEQGDILFFCGCEQESDTPVAKTLFFFIIVSPIVFTICSVLFFIHKKRKTTSDKQKQVQFRNKNMLPSPIMGRQIKF